MLHGFHSDFTWEIHECKYVQTHFITYCMYIAYTCIYAYWVFSYRTEDWNNNVVRLAGELANNYSGLNSLSSHVGAVKIGKHIC